MKTPAVFLVLVALVAMSSIMLVGQIPGPDWPQFRGPNRDGVATSFTEPKAWPEQMKRVWKADVGDGYSTPILVGSRVYAFARLGNDEVMQALDAATGKVLWQTRYPAPVTINPAAKAHGPGPKSTPTFAGGRLFTLGMGGIVTAFDAASGKQLWQKPAAGTQPLYGTAMSPLVDRGLVIVHVGGHNQGALTAFDAGTGAVKWTWNGDGPSYASPIVADIDGVRQVITFSQENLVGVSAADGRLLWRRPFSTEYTQNIITPILIGQTPHRIRLSEADLRDRRRQEGRSVEHRGRLGEPRGVALHGERRCRRRHAPRTDPSQPRAVRAARCEDREDVVDRHASTGRERVARASRQRRALARGGRGSDRGSRQSKRISGAEAIHGCRRGHLVRAGHLRKPHSREGRISGHALDGGLISGGSLPHRCRRARVGHKHPDHAILPRRDEQLAIPALADVQIGARHARAIRALDEIAQRHVDAVPP
jgi:hypothetical protein